MRYFLFSCTPHTPQARLGLPFHTQFDGCGRSASFTTKVQAGSSSPGGRGISFSCAFMQNRGMGLLLGCLENLGTIPILMLRSMLYPPLRYAPYAIGLIVCSVSLFKLFVYWLTSLVTSLSCGVVGSAALILLRKLACFIPWAVACCGFIWFVQNSVLAVFYFGVVGEMTLGFVSFRAVLRLFACCGVRPSRNCWCSSHYGEQPLPMNPRIHRLA